MTTPHADDEDPPRGVVRGLLYAAPVSVVLWLGIVWLVRWMLLP
jgi:hypothetical protein